MFTHMFTRMQHACTTCGSRDPSWSLKDRAILHWAHAAGMDHTTQAVWCVEMDHPIQDFGSIVRSRFDDLKSGSSDPGYCYVIR